MISSEDKFYYENEINGILSYIPFEYIDYYTMVDLWTTTSPYRDYESKTIRERLRPAFDNKQIMLFKKGINSIGFISWAYMSDYEFETKTYNDETFRREEGDKFVITDAILLGGSKNVRTCVRHFVEFGKKYYPDVNKAHFYRVKTTWRNGNIYNKGYK